MRRRVQLCIARLTFWGLVASPATAQVDRMVAVDGLDVHVVTMGVDVRGPDQPLVIFESGAGNGWDSWEPILRQVAELAPVLAYDRSGLGSTASDGLPPTPEREVDRLRGLLSALDLSPPYLLVGHSWGGALIHQFAVSHPGHVAGMVYVDPTDFTWRDEDARVLMEAVAPGGGWIDWFEQRERQQLAARARYDAATLRGVDARDAYMGTAYQPPPDVPVSVIKAARPVRTGRSAPPSSPGTFDARTYMDRFGAAREQRLRSWVRSGGEFVVAGTTDHFVHQSQPDLVVGVIQRIVLLQAPR